MTDAELQVYLGIAGKEGADKIMASITPEKRALYESMAAVETEIELWQLGLAPKPVGVIVCGCGRRGQHLHGRER